MSWHSLGQEPILDSLSVADSGLIVCEHCPFAVNLSVIWREGWRSEKKGGRALLPETSQAVSVTQLVLEERVRKRWHQAFRDLGTCPV